MCTQASTNVHLFVEILNRYLFFLEVNSSVLPRFVPTRFPKGEHDVTWGPKKNQSPAIEPRTNIKMCSQGGNKKINERFRAA